MAGFAKINFLWSLLTIPLGLLSLYFYLFKRKPNLDLKNKVVFITGASSGIGKACAEAFFNAGSKIILSGRKKDSLEDVKHELLRKNNNQGDNTCHEPRIVVMDLEDLESIPDKMKEAMNSFGQIDIVLNNAGMSARGLASDTDLDIYQKIMDVNFYAQILVTKAVLPHMMEKRSGQIVVISSIQGLISLPGRTAYSSSKHALEGYFESLRSELALFNVDVCVINPSYIKTNLSLNAVCGDGSKYGEMDKTLENGYSPTYAAAQIVDSVTNRLDNKMICPLYIHLAVCLRIMAPSLFFRIMERKMRKEASTMKKKS